MYKRITSLVVSVTSIVAFTGLTAYTHSYDHARQQLEAEAPTGNPHVNLPPSMSVDNQPVASNPTPQHEHEHEHKPGKSDVVEHQHPPKDNNQSGAAVDKEKTARTRAS